MLTKVEVYTEQGMMLSLPLGDSDSGYLVKSIDGLDPNKATLVSSGFALLDGEQYQNSHGDKRNIIMNLGYDTNVSTSVRERRNNLYGYMMPKSPVTLVFYISDFPVVEIKGRVESFDGPMFTQDPEATISIVCFDPAFYSQDPLVVDASTTSDTEADAESIPYQGTVETGFVFSMLVDRDLQSFTIAHSFANGLGETLDFAYDLDSGDELEINTIAGSKSVYLTRDGNRSSILWAVTPDSDWITLYPGANSFQVLAEGAPVAYSLEYREKFGGL